MGFWSAILLIVVVVTLGDVLRRVLNRSQSGNQALLDEVERLKNRLNKLEERKKESVEERLANIEKIVIDQDFSLNREINKALKDDDKEESE